MSARLDRSIPFVDTIFRVIEGVTPQTEAVELLRHAEDKYGVSILKPAIADLPEASEDLYVPLIQGAYFSFLTETHLVFSHAALYDETTLVLPGHFTWTATWRAWGATLAEWANQSRWGGKTDWHYMDFYSGYPVDHFIDFEPWQEAVLQVIEAKSKLGGTQS